MMNAGIMLLWIQVAGLAGLVACKDAVQNPTDSYAVCVDTSYHFSYDLARPDTTFFLPDRLREISGLSMLPGDTSLAAVQDELGIVFVVDLRSGQILTEVKFEENGDFEGVEFVGEDLYVLKSNGQLYRLQRFFDESRKIEKIKTNLGKDADAEGLGFSAAHHALLMACKGRTRTDSASQRSVFGFDTATLVLDTVPLLSIDQAKVQQHLQSGNDRGALEKLLQSFQSESGEFSFAPSAIATHLVSGEIFVLSSVGKMLVVLDPAGRILHIEKLKKSIHPQPEGICFQRDGTLWISSEGRDGASGRLLCFSAQSPK
jgi:uncharacterized protein YjiK